MENTAITDCCKFAEEADKFFLASQYHCVAALLPAAALDDSALITASTSRRQQSPGLCFYHAKFGAKAKQCLSPCSFSGAGNAGVGCTGRLLFIHDSISGRRFLCDTGAQRSVLPASCLDVVVDSHGPPMEAANGSPIRTYGTGYLGLCFGGLLFPFWALIFCMLMDC